ncbi:MAG TPA: sulfur carrier protein ThiS [Phycisphaeraceae bacterium]
MEMELIINGQPRQITARTVRELLDQLGLANQAVAVEVNRQLVPKRQHEQAQLHEGDVVEVVTLVGGG